MLQTIVLGLSFLFLIWRAGLRLLRLIAAFIAYIGNGWRRWQAEREVAAVIKATQRRARTAWR